MLEGLDVDQYQEYLYCIHIINYSNEPHMHTHMYFVVKRDKYICNEHLVFDYFDIKTR